MSEICVECGEPARLRIDYDSLCDRHYMTRNHFIVVHDIIEKNGKSIRENNLEKKHRIPIGTLVELKYENWFGNGACEKVHARLWVVAHVRDCDGTPLYSLCRRRDPPISTMMERIMSDVISGYDEESLTPIEVTPELCYGTGALTWDED